MRGKIFAITIFLLTLLPVLDIGDVATLYAQNFAYENGTYWLPDITVTGNDPSKIICDCCGESFEDRESFERHLKYNKVCASYFGINDDGVGGDDDTDDHIEGYCVFCSLPIELCTCHGVDVTGSYGGHYGSGGSTGIDASSGDSSNSIVASPTRTAKSMVSFSKLQTAFVKRGYDRPYNKKTCGYCLRGWKTVWRDAGIGEYDGTVAAKDFGPILLKYGFKVIAEGKGENRPSGYTPQIGDTRVWDAYPGQSGSYGHIDWYNGIDWVSDYTQSGNGLWAPGPGYRKNNTNYKIYR